MEKPSAARALGVVVNDWGLALGQSDSYEAALADAKSAAQFHIESFGTEAFDDDSDVEAAYVAEGNIVVV